jgi:hypothetical protein
MRIFRYLLSFSAIFALSATAVFAQLSSSAIQTVTFSVKRTQVLASLSTPQVVAGQGQNVPDRGDRVSQAAVNISDPMAVGGVKISVTESIDSNSSVDVLPVVASPLEVEVSTSTFSGRTTIPSPGTYQKSSSHVHPLDSSSSTWVVMTITD